MNRTDRLYALVEELRAAAPRPQSARQLAGRYEVSTRTIERDILALQESGVPIYAESGRRGGYVIDKALTLPPLNFTAAEMVAMAVSLDGQRRHHSPPRCAARCVRYSLPPRPHGRRRRHN
jgi:predicted DNA-binding transcriptional regulator YafY